MGTTTGIEWTDATWNPIRGCSRVSEGCRNCYAEKFAYRFSGAGQPYEGLAQLVNGHAAWTGKVDLVEKHLLDPLKWKSVGVRSPKYQTGVIAEEEQPQSRPRRIFVNSMSDLFHPNMPDEWIDRIFAVMALCPQHTFQVLTKRPERMLEYLSAPDVRKSIAREANALMRSGGKAAHSDGLSHVFLWSRLDHAEIGEYVNYLSGIADRCWPLPNVQLGVSVEDQKTADERIPLLLQTPAAVRFISAEPLLGTIKLRAIHNDEFDLDFLRGDVIETDPCSARERFPYGSKLDWVIVGGESGPGARPMHPDWARSLRDQCVEAGVPFFFKQWGEWAPGENVDRNTGTVETATWFNGHWGYGRENLANDEGHVDDQPDVYRIGKKAAGSLLDGREWKEFPR